MLLAGCGGGGGGVDANGFTASQRNAARNVLVQLGQTSVYDIALNTSLTQAEVPTTCVVHIEETDPLTFKMFLSWVPNPEALGYGPRGSSGYVRAYSWLEAQIGADGLRALSFLRQRADRGRDALALRRRLHEARGEVPRAPNRRFGLLPCRLAPASPRRASTPCGPGGEPQRRASPRSLGLGGTSRSGTSASSATYGATSPSSAVWPRAAQWPVADRPRRRVAAATVAETVPSATDASDASRSALDGSAW